MFISAWNLLWIVPLAILGGGVVAFYITNRLVKEAIKGLWK